jgi:hypothetical protein
MRAQNLRVKISVSDHRDEIAAGNVRASAWFASAAARAQNLRVKMSVSESADTEDRGSLMPKKQINDKKGGNRLRRRPRQRGE